MNLPFITATDAGPLHLQKKLTRAEFQKMTEHLLGRTKGPFERAVADAGVTTSSIDHVVLVGGSTRMPAVKELVQQLTGKEPHRGVNPDEVVAAGAALQAGVLTGGVKEILLLDVTPLTLGIETEGAVMTKMIERNTTIPTKRAEMFSTAADNQLEVPIHVLQGERAMAGDNKSLGQFVLTGIPPALRGVPQIEVTFDIDANGIVSVNAKDLGTGREQAMTITGGTALSSDEIDRMVEDAERYAEEDARRRALAEVRNQADQLANQTEKLLEEHGGELDEGERAALETALADLRGAAGGEDADAEQIQDKIDEVAKASQPLVQKMYDSRAAEGGEGPAAAAEPLDDDEEIVEAEVIEEEDGR